MILEEKNMARVTKDMTIGEVLKLHPKMAEVLMKGGMHCVGCSASLNETIEEAAYVHGIEPFLLEAKLNAFLSEAEMGRV